MVKKKNLLEEYKEGIFNSIFAISNILVVVIYYKNILLTHILVLLIALIGLYHWKSKRTLIIFILGGIVGALAEMFCIKFGVWKYSVPNFYNIPIWLFIVWGNATALIYQVAKQIKEKRLK